MIKSVSTDQSGVTSDHLPVVAWFKNQEKNREKGVVMHTGQYTDVSIKMSGFLLKITGILKATNSSAERRRKFMVVYTVAALVYGVYVNVVDIYHNLHNLDVSKKVVNPSWTRLLLFIWTLRFSLKRVRVVDRTMCQ